jgi:flagellar protein FlgJ
MIRAVSGPMPLAAPKESDDARLKKTAQQLEGVFVEQLYKAMRETVPQGEGVVDGGSGADMFKGLMDQRLAAETPTQWAHGLAAAAYRQLRHALPGAEPTEGAHDGALETAPALTALRPQPPILPLAVVPR